MFNPIISNVHSARLETPVDSNGHFVLSSHFAEGIALTVTDSSTGHRAFRSIDRGISPNADGEIDLGSIQMSPTGHMAFRTESSYENFALFIPGSDRWTLLPCDQWVTLDSVAYRSDYTVQLFDIAGGKVMTTFESVNAGDSCSLHAVSSGGRTTYKLFCR
jgi:hypothetical protein